MAILIGDNLNYSGPKPDFARQQYATIAEMKAVVDARMPEMYLAYCLETHKVYLYNKQNLVDPVFGRFRVFTSEGPEIEAISAEEIQAIFDGEDPSPNQSFLDNEGLAQVKGVIQSKLPMCDELPAEPEVGDIRLYLGSNTSEYKQGHIYRFQHSEKHLYAWRVRVGRVYETVYSEAPIPEVGYQMLWKDDSQADYVVAYYDSENQELGLNRYDPGDSPAKDDEDPPHADYYGTRYSESDIDEDKFWWEDISQAIRTQKYQTTTDEWEIIRLRVPYPFNGTVFQITVVPPSQRDITPVVLNVVNAGNYPFVYALPNSDFDQLVGSFQYRVIDGEYSEITFEVETLNTPGEDSPEDDSNDEPLAEDSEEIESTVVYATQIGGPQVYYELSATNSSAGNVLNPEPLLSNDLPSPVSIDQSTYTELDRALSALCTAVSARLRLSGAVDPTYLPNAGECENQVYRITADFTTTSDFRVQGIELKAGSAIYSDGQYWNVFSAVPPITVDSSMSDSSTNPVQNNVVKSYVDSAKDEAVQTAGQNAASAISNAIQALDASQVGGSGKIITEVSQTDGVLNATAVDIDSAMSDSSTNVVQNKIIKAYVDSGLNDKVDKVSGKGLSTNDFTSSEKDKLDGIATGAQVNVQSDWNEADRSADSFIKNKPGLAAVATSGSYTDLSDTPNLATVATSGSYSDLVNTPEVDTTMSDSSTNAVQNNVIKAYVDAAEQAAKDYCDLQITQNITKVLNAEY